MNKRGIRLPLTVTLGNGKKIYHTAEKCFSISPSVPVAIMTFGAADMMSVPWETVIKVYTQGLHGRTFDRLDQYAKNFFTFVEGATTLFPPEDQERHVKGAVEAVWTGLCLDKLSDKLRMPLMFPSTTSL